MIKIYQWQTVQCCYKPRTNCREIGVLELHQQRQRISTLPFELVFQRPSNKYHCYVCMVCSRDMLCIKNRIGHETNLYVETSEQKICLFLSKSALMKKLNSRKRTHRVTGMFENGCFGWAFLRNSYTCINFYIMSIFPTLQLSVEESESFFHALFV